MEASADLGGREGELEHRATSIASRYQDIADLLSTGLSDFPAAISVEIRADGERIAWLSRGFVEGCVDQQDISARLLACRLPHRDRPTFYEAHWKSESLADLSITTCPVTDVPVSVAQGRRVRRPQLLRVDVAESAVSVQVKVGETSETVFAALDGALVGWWDLNPEKGDIQTVTCKFPEIKPVDADRVACFLADGSQMLLARPAQALPSSVTGMFGPKFRLAAEDALYVSIIGQKAPHVSRLLVIYAIHTKEKSLSLMHRTIIGEFKKRGAVVILVNSYNLHAAQMSKDAAGADILISRTDYGRDFASWCVVFELYSEWISNFERTIFINDSLIGPLVDMSVMFDFFAGTRAGLSALSDSYQSGYHAQSSLFQIRREAWKNERFRRFFLDYRYPDKRVLVVEQGEIGLSRAAQAAGIRIETMCPYNAVAKSWLHRIPKLEQELQKLPECQMSVSVAVDRRAETFVWEFFDWVLRKSRDIRVGTPLNPQHTFWDVLIEEFQYPFIKRDILLLNPEALPNLFQLGALLGPRQAELARAILQGACDNAVRAYAA